ncbi:hypothetical protein BDN72DRAFT_959569 [Pluteus cervinus]|uniref:Uncharacterized protein n=1 Tax=Pluteus cervinus TaxID=181527 RepID=A0ACD3AVB9_9AGAR|nr:hypothetical protein BDN72DRAFT_959569 [Pluteus cervinus]
MNQSPVDSAIGASQGALIQQDMNGYRDNLPPEIEHEIFVLAFYNDKKGRVNLLRVAKRMSEWLIPKLYEAMVIAREPHVQPYPPIDSLERHGHHVRRLLATFVPPPMTVHRLLSACPNATDLALWHGPTTSSQVLHLPITRLLIESHDFVGTNLWDLPKTLQIKQWCSNITHVVLATQVDVSDSLLNIPTLFPSLTHLMTFCWNEPPVVRRLLANCKQLEVFIWLWGRGRADAPIYVVEGLDECPVDDRRIVTLNGSYVNDWIRGSRGEDDLWILAEREIQNQKKAN